jgi:hypothetical protein
METRPAVVMAHDEAIGVLEEPISLRPQHQPAVSTPQRRDS